MAVDESDEDALAELGAWLLEWRRTAGLSQRTLARLAGVDQAWLSRVERARMPRASAYMLARVIRVLDGATAGRGPGGLWWDRHAGRW